jgi:putative mRNA 3-end processing factor
MIVLQTRIENKGEVWVVSGDYKIEDDGLSGKIWTKKHIHY